MAKKRKKKSVLKKRILQGIALVSLISLIIWLVIPAPIPVQTEEARIGSLYSFVEGDAQTRAVDRYGIWTPVAGTLQRMAIGLGQPVVADQVIARITPDALSLPDAETTEFLNTRMSTAEALKTRAIAQRDRAVDALDRARDTLRDTEQRAAVGQATAIQRDQAQTAVKLAFKELEATNLAVHGAAYDIAAVQDAAQQLRGSRNVREWVLRSPASGTVLAVTEEKKLGVGGIVMTVGNPKELEVAAQISAKDAVKLRAGLRVVLAPTSGAKLDGRVRRIEPAASADGNAVAVIEFTAAPAKWQPLGHGSKLNARIITNAVDSVVKVPVKALVEVEGKSAVYVVEKGKARKRFVTAGTRNTEEAVILDGVQEYDRVIVLPDPKIEDGTRVKMR